MDQKFILISHNLCPYVQRAVIVLNEKGVAFERRDIDLANKPDWFLAVSPLGKTPVLLVDGKPIFESSVICEYLDETLAPRIHPHDAFVRAEHRGWMEFGSVVLNSIGNFYSASNKDSFAKSQADLKQKFERIEEVLGDGEYFSGKEFSMVDVVFGPVFRYFDVIDLLVDHDIFNHTPKVNVWRKHLMERPSIKLAVSEDYANKLEQFIRNRKSVLAERFAFTCAI
jgi:glutathione S-transferase